LEAGGLSDGIESGLVGSDMESGGVAAFCFTSGVGGGNGSGGGTSGRLDSALTGTI
jgi:hypothetical protein